MRRITTSLALAAALVVAGCEADQETFEAGGTLEAPAAVEQAPATPFPSTPETTQGLEQPGSTVMPPMGADSMATPDSAQPAAPE